MRLQYHERDVNSLRESTGRTDQKRRTRTALVAAARDLVAKGLTPTVEEAAGDAGVSRTAAYRYFPNQRALLMAAHPETAARSLLPDDAPREVDARLDTVVQAFTGLIVDTEAQQRTMLRLSLEADPARTGGAAPASRPGDRLDRGGTGTAASSADRAADPPTDAGDPQCDRASRPSPGSPTWPVSTGARPLRSCPGRLARCSMKPSARRRPRMRPRTKADHVERARTAASGIRDGGSCP